MIMECLAENLKGVENIESKKLKPKGIQLSGDGETASRDSNGESRAADNCFSLGRIHDEQYGKCTGDLPTVQKNGSIRSNCKAFDRSL